MQTKKIKGVCKSDLVLQAANELITGFHPFKWSLDQVGRTLLILSFPHEDEYRYVATLDKIFAAADVRESIALYQSLPLLPCILKEVVDRSPLG